MIIKEVAVGNSTECYIEKDFTSSFNILYSNENNKGKTIVIQSILYVLGNEPTFPQSFNYKDYYYVLEFEHNEDNIWICRRNTQFIIYKNESIYLADSVSEFKRYWDKNIFKLPRIIKNGELKLVDPVLFVQLFFVGQDKKSTDDIANKGYYKKDDFINMLYQLNGTNSVSFDQSEIDQIKRRLEEIKDKKKNLKQKNKILNSNSKASSYLSSQKDKEEFEDILRTMKNLTDEISKLKRERKKYINISLSWENTIKELNSLNRSIALGELRCADCNSKNIVYRAKNDSFTFDVSTKEMRNHIISSIKEKIEINNEEIEKLNYSIQEKQKQLKQIMIEDDITLESLVVFKGDLLSSNEIDKELNDLDTESIELANKLKINEEEKRLVEENKENFITKVLEYMNDFYKGVDPQGNIVFDRIFSKKGTTLSGSDGTVFYLAKIYALAKVLNHSLPIIIDSFRAEDLSTFKEDVVIERYSELSNQIIFTTTVKKEEQNKYSNQNSINSIDYSDHESSKLLQKDDMEEFKSFESIFMISIE